MSDGQVKAQFYPDHHGPNQVCLWVGPKEAQSCVNWLTVEMFAHYMSMVIEAHPGLVRSCPEHGSYVILGMMNVGQPLVLSVADLVAPDFRRDMQALIDRVLYQRQAYYSGNWTGIADLIFNPN